MSRKSEEQFYELTMTYLPPASQEETKPLGGSKDPRTLLVARCKGLGHRIHQGMCSLPTVKDPHPQKTCTTVLHPHRRKHAPIPSGSHGFDYWPTSTKRSGCHPHNHRPWMLQSSTIPTMFHSHLRSRNCTTIP